MSLHAHVLLQGEDLKVGQPWPATNGMHASVEIGSPAAAWAVLQGSPEDLDRLANAIIAAADRARTAEAELRAKHEQDGGR